MLFEIRLKKVFYFKPILIQFPRTNIDCVAGDNLVVFGSDKNELLFNFCNPLYNQLSNSILTESSHVFLTVSTKTERQIRFYFAYFINTAFLPQTTTPAVASYLSK